MKRHMEDANDANDNERAAADAVGGNCELVVVVPLAPLRNPYGSPLLPEHIPLVFSYLTTMADVVAMARVQYAWFCAVRPCVARIFLAMPHRVRELYIARAVRALHTSSCVASWSAGSRWMSSGLVLSRLINHVEARVQFTTLVDLVRRMLPPTCRQFPPLPILRVMIALLSDYPLLDIDHTAMSTLGTFLITLFAEAICLRDINAMHLICTALGATPGQPSNLPQHLQRRGEPVAHVTRRFLWLPAYWPHSGRQKTQVYPDTRYDDRVSKAYVDTLLLGPVVEFEIMNHLLAFYPILWWLFPSIQTMCAHVARAFVATPTRAFADRALQFVLSKPHLWSLGRLQDLVGAVQVVFKKTDASVDCQQIWAEAFGRALFAIDFSAAVNLFQ